MDIETKWIPFTVKGVDRETRTLEGYASTSMPDYEGEVILPSAWKESLKAWKKQGSRPKFLAYHKHALDSGHSPVIGTIESMEIVGDGLRFAASFADTELGREHLELYATKAMDAFSVGFIPQERELEPEKISKLLEKNAIDPKGTPVSKVTTKAHILEVSAVCLGMNMGALVRSVEPVAVKALDRLKAEGVAIVDDKAVEVAPPAETKSEKVIFDNVPKVEPAEEKPADVPVALVNDPEPNKAEELAVELCSTLKDLAAFLVAHATATENALKAIDARVNEIKVALDDIAEVKSGEPGACACATKPQADAKGKSLSDSYLANIYNAAKAVKETLKR